MTLYCPAHIEFLLWCHTRCEGHPNRDLALYRDLASDLLKEGVIKGEGDGRFSTTEKGRDASGSEKEYTSQSCGMSRWLANRQCGCSHPWNGEANKL